MIPALVAGFLAGSVPTADILARWAGHDLRNSGSGNPGANNARRVGGWRLAAAVLLTEMTKGALAAGIALAIAGDGAGIAAGLGVVAGNIYNPWYRFRGGQGLGATAGVLAAAWPLGLLFGLVVIASGAKMSSNTYRAAIVTFVALVGAGALWPALDLAFPWGLELGWIWLALGLTALVVPKQVNMLRRSGPRQPRG